MVDFSEYLRIAIWGGAAILGFLALGAVVVIYRRYYRANDDAADQAPWSLEDLSAMRRRGDLSEREYAYLRDRALAQMGVRPREGGEKST